MSLVDNKVDINNKEMLEEYHDTFYQECHEWRDYQLTSSGFREWYYDCLPADTNARILDIG